MNYKISIQVPTDSHHKNGNIYSYPLPYNIYLSASVLLDLSKLLSFIAHTSTRLLKTLSRLTFWGCLYSITCLTLP